MCCVRAGHVAEGVAARRHMMRPGERVLIIPVVVDRSNDSAFYIIAFGAVGMFIILSVLGLQIRIGSKPFLCATLRKNIQQEELLYEECV